MGTVTHCPQPKDPRGGKRCELSKHTKLFWWCWNFRALWLLFHPAGNGVIPVSVGICQLQVLYYFTLPTNLRNSLLGALGYCQTFLYIHHKIWSITEIYNYRYNTMHPPFLCLTLIHEQKEFESQLILSLKLTSFYLVSYCLSKALHLALVLVCIFSLHVTWWIRDLLFSHRLEMYLRQMCWTNPEPFPFCYSQEAVDISPSFKADNLLQEFSVYLKSRLSPIWNISCEMLITTTFQVANCLSCWSCYDCCC